jgi:hypothetical protein
MCQIFVLRKQGSAKLWEISLGYFFRDLLRELYASKFPMKIWQLFIALGPAFGTSISEGVEHWPCASQLSELPVSAKQISSTTDKLAAIQKIRSLVFQGFRLSGIPSSAEIPTFLSKSHDLYDNELAGRLAFFEKALNDPKRADTVTLFADETLGEPGEANPTQQFFMAQAFNKANYVTSQKQRIQLGRLKFSRTVIWGMMTASAIAQSTLCLISHSYLGAAVSCAHHFGLAWLMDHGIKKIAHGDIYGFDFDHRLESYQEAYELNHQSIQAADKSDWAYLSINIGEERKWDLFTHWEPGSSPKLTTLVLAYGP